ncbi:MAG: hypothetical protein ACOYMG_21190, partial [Candidatus Methylumidiphilus sp.]
ASLRVHDQPETPSTITLKRASTIAEIRSNHTPTELMIFIQTIEKALGQDAKKNYLPMQAGDVVATYADVTALNAVTGFEPKTPLQEGIARWVQWYLSYQVIHSADRQTMPSASK